MLSANTNGHLLGDEFKAVHKTLSEVFDVMVSQNEIFTAGEGTDHVIPKARSAMGEITQMEDNAVIRHVFLHRRMSSAFISSTSLKGRPQKRMMFSCPKWVLEVNQT